MELGFSFLVSENKTSVASAQAPTTKLKEIVSFLFRSIKPNFSLNKKTMSSYSSQYFRGSKFSSNRRLWWPRAATQNFTIFQRFNKK